MAPTTARPCSSSFWMIRLLSIRSILRCTFSYRAAVGMAQDHDQLSAQMVRRVFDTAKLVVVDHVAGQTDHEQIADPALEDGFRNDTGI